MEWTGARYADTPTVESRTWVDAPPERVWEFVSDIELMPRVSSELQSVEWLDGLTGPAVGARFVGHNAHEAIGEWSTTSYIVRYEPPTVFAWAVENPDTPTALWRFTCVAEDGGTMLTQWVQLGPGRSGLSQAIEQMPDKEQKIVHVRLAEFENSIHATLESIKTMAEQG